MKVGDKVYLKIHPLHQLTMPIQLHPKLVAHYCGPFVVFLQIGLVAYKLQLHENTHIHPIFHFHS